MDTKEMLKNASLESQGHTGIMQNFDVLSDDPGEQKTRRVAIDLRTLISAAVAFALVAAAGVYFAYNAGAATIPGADQTSAQALKRAETEQIAAPTPEVCPEIPASEQNQAIDIAGRVNLNLATLQDLQTLTGVGPSTAQRILDWRAENGKFSSKEDLKDVKGIGEATFEKLKDKITV